MLTFVISFVFLVVRYYITTETKPFAAPVVVQSDNFNFNTGVLLNEHNYDLWAPLIEMHIAGRKKMGYFFWLE